MSKTEALRLLAEDAEDLAVISAALQDAVAQVRDLEWDARGRRFTLALNRYRWEAPGMLLGGRVRAGLQFGSVLAVKSRNLRRETPEAVVELLAVSFEPGEAPAARSAWPSPAAATSSWSSNASTRRWPTSPPPGRPRARRRTRVRRGRSWRRQT